MGQDEIVKKSLLTRIKGALDGENYDEASALQVEMQEKASILAKLYTNYKKNLL